MKALLLYILLVAFGFVHNARPQDLLKSIQSLVEFERPGSTVDSYAYMAASDQAIRAWNIANEDEKIRFASRMFLVHFRRASILADSNNFQAATHELKAEAAMQKEFNGRLEFATKSPDIFFRDLVELQAQLTFETGSDPLAGRVGYSFEKDGDGFTAARFELGDDIAGITVPEIGDDEALALVHQLKRQGGKFVAAASRWLVVPKGPLHAVLKQATREVVFDSDGKMMIHRLQAQVESSTKVNAPAATYTSSSQVPSLVPPSTPKKAPATKPTTTPPSEEPTSSTPWSMIVLLVVATGGLLWVLLNRRS